ncbi:MAG: hypothetical protein JWM44_360, partial [Bacilli bacterium]|nr:hypothetical protein [Bacilli bacterium]
MIRIGHILNFAVHFYAALAFIPYLSFIVLWFITYFITHDKKKSTRISIDVTTLLLIGAVARQLHKLFGSSLGFWILLFILLLSAGLIGRQQNDLRGTVNVMRILKIM